MSSLENAALDYAAAGHPVFPLQPNGKTPLTAHGLEDATVDETTIQGWWQRWPNANVAIRTGDVVVVDEDRLGAFEEFASEAHETIPRTSVVQTASGRHFYFRQPEGQRIRNTAGRLAPGIDTRGEGGYVVAPPSVHPSGAQYQWVQLVDEILVMPDWLAERLVRQQPERRPLPADLSFAPGTTPYGQRALDQEISAVANAPEGTRNHTLNTAAFALGQLVAGGEVDQIDALRSLDAAAKSAGLPGLESDKTIRSGFGAGLAEPRRAPESGTLQRSTTNGTAALKLVTAEADPLTATEPERDSWLPLNLNDLPDEPPVPPNLGDTHLIYPGKRHVFSGPPESAKTLGAYCVLIQIARKGGLGILIDFEMGSFDAHTRLRELGATPSEIDRILFVEPEEPATPERIMRLVDLNPSLVVIDAAAGVYSLEGLDDNKRLDVEKVSTLYIKLFWRNGIASILIDHVVKDGESRGRYAIGSERKLGGADVHLGFDVISAISRGTDGKYKITTHKDRGGFHKRGYLADMTLSSDPQTHNITWKVTEPVLTTDRKGQFRYTINMERISVRLELASTPMGVNELKADVKGGAKEISAAINTLIDEGYVHLQEGPNRSKLLSSTRPYREADDPLKQADEEASESVGRVWFASDSQITAESGGSVSRGALAPDPPAPLLDPAENQPETSGWFAEDGSFDDAQQNAWLSSVDPGPDDLEL